jgi:hypothetical protein
VPVPVVDVRVVHVRAHHRLAAVRVKLMRLAKVQPHAQRHERRTHEKTVVGALAVRPRYRTSNVSVAHLDS